MKIQGYWWGIKMIPEHAIDTLIIKELESAEYIDSYETLLEVGELKPKKQKDGSLEFIR